jgi:hypothetical protein
LQPIGRFPRRPRDPWNEPIWDAIELLFFAYRDFIGDPDDVLAKFIWPRPSPRAAFRQSPIPA